MTSTIKNKNQKFETFSASGTVWLTLDNQFFFRRRFEHHVKICIQYDDGAQSGDQEVDSLSSILTPGCSDFSSENHGVPIHNFIKLKPFKNVLDSLLPVEYDNHIDKQKYTNKREEMKLPHSECNLVEKAAIFQSDHSSGKASETVSFQDLASDDPLEEDRVEVVLNTGGENCHKETIKNKKKVVSHDYKGRKRKRNFKRLTNKIVKTNKRTAKKKLSKKSKTQHSRLSKIQKPDLSLNLTFYGLSKKSDGERLLNSPALKGNIFHKEKADAKRKKKMPKLEQEKNVKCEYCLEVFKSQQEFLDHRKGDRTSYNCSFCSKVVPFKAHLMVHMREHNKNMMGEIFPYDIDSDNNGKTLLKTTISNPNESCVDKNIKSVKCDICGLVVSNISILRTHTMIHTEEYAFKCCVCGEKTHSIARRNNHLATHLKAGKVQCKICNISFESRSELSKHQLTHEFKCNICDKVFPNKTSRVFHYKMAHKDEILKCPTCGKMFSSNDELLPHLKYHRNRAKTQCTICGLFVTRLDNHLLSHNQSSDDCKMYVCDKCPKKFKQKLSFQRHVRTHSEEKPYACMECPKKFARSGGLRRHMITHTHEKPFVCEICGKACSQMGNLRIHMQIHKDTMPVQCEVCGANFIYKNALQDHMRESHYADVNVIGSSKYLTTAPQLFYLS